MSRFFRSGNSTSTDTTSNSSEEIITDVKIKSRHEQQDSSPELLSVEVKSAEDVQTAVSNQNILVESASDRLDAAYERDLVLLASLEENCLFHALKELNTQRGQVIGVNSALTEDSPEVQALARAKYDRLCSQLCKMGLIQTNRHTDAFRPRRDFYRQGLEYLEGAGHNREGQAFPTEASSALVRIPSVQQIEAANRVAFEHNANANAVPLLSLPTLPDVLRPLVKRSIFGNHYYEEFEEVRLLGKGGYGKVFEVQSPIDGQRYAIKKIPLSEKRLRTVQTQESLNALLAEIRVLADSHHQNIIRYHHAWLEHVPWSRRGSSRAHFVVPQRKTIQTGHWDGAVDLSDKNAPKLTDIVRFALDDSSSGYRAASSRSHQRRESAATVATITSSSSVASAHSRRPTATEDVEGADSIRKDLQMLHAAASVSESPSSFFATTDPYEAPSKPDQAPVLTLHIQMAVHPLTLSKFLLPPLLKDSGAQQHCFHLAPSIGLLLAIMDGVQYLHRKNIVHRDLKPSNILLCSSTDDDSPGSVDVSSCRPCVEALGKSKESLYLSPKIGDFGLVTLISAPDLIDTAGLSPLATSEAVGTEFYRPPGDGCGAMDEKVDVYALGVIAMELLCCFETKMERYQALRDLKDGILPKSIQTQFGECGKRLASCILGMVERDRRNRLTCAEARRLLTDLLRLEKTR